MFRVTRWRDSSMWRVYGVREVSVIFKNVFRPNSIVAYTSGTGFRDRCARGPEFKAICYIPRNYFTLLLRSRDGERKARVQDASNTLSDSVYSTLVTCDRFVRKVQSIVFRNRKLTRSIVVRATCVRTSELLWRGTIRKRDVMCKDGQRTRLVTNVPGRLSRRRDYDDACVRTAVCGTGDDVL